MPPRNKSKGKRKQQGGKSDGDSHGAIRTPRLDDEVFATATRMMGGAQVRVACADGVDRLCIIRNKFRGRGKFGNLVSVGSLILVGRRAWSGVRTDKLPICDMLCVYTTDEARTLKHRGELPGSLFAGTADAAADDDDGLEFANDAQTTDGMYMPPLEDSSDGDGDPVASDQQPTVLATGTTVGADDI